MKKSWKKTKKWARLMETMKHIHPNASQAELEEHAAKAYPAYSPYVSREGSHHSTPLPESVKRIWSEDKGY